MNFDRRPGIDHLPDLVHLHVIDGDAALGPIDGRVPDAIG